MSLKRRQVDALEAIAFEARTANLIAKQTIYYDAQKETAVLYQGAMLAGTDEEAAVALSHLAEAYVKQMRVGDIVNERLGLPITPDPDRDLIASYIINPEGKATA